MFQGPDPYGTPGGDDSQALPVDPEDNRLAVGQTHITYLRVNGPITIRNRNSVEQVIRTIGENGGTVVAIIVKDDGAIIDSNLAEVDFTDGISVTQSAPGVVLVKIPSGGISAAMLANAIVDASKLASNAVTTAKVQDGAITAVKLADQYALLNHVHSARLDTQGIVAARTLGTSGANSLNQSPLTLTLTAGIVYDIIAIWFLSGFALDGVRAVSQFSLNLGGVEGAKITIENDGGVDRTIPIVTRMTTAGESSVVMSFNYYWVEGRVSQTTGWYIAIASPRR